MKVYLVSGFGTTYIKHVASSEPKAIEYAEKLYLANCNSESKRFLKADKEEINENDWREVISIRCFEIDDIE